VEPEQTQRSRTRLNTRVWLGAVGAIAAFVALFLTFAKPAALVTDAEAQGDSSRPVEFDDPDRTIDVGMHIENIHQFSMKDKVYNVEGWYWLRWTPTIQKTLDTNKIALENIVEFTNVIEGTSPDVEKDSSRTQAASGGRRYQLFRFSGRFYVNDLDLHKSPFQTVDLPVIVELRQDELSCYEGGPECVYLKPYPGDGGALVGQYAEINGFKLTGSHIAPSIHQYTTTFGQGPPSAFGRVDFSVEYHSDVLSAFTQHVLPLLIILAFVLVSPSLPSSMGDVRLAIPATALLTLIFMQQTYRADIPSLSYVTFMDWLYAYAYVVSMSLFVLFCWGTYRYSIASEEDQPATVARINRIDTVFQVTALAALALTVLLAWLL
jgi:hypothetical protein